MKGKRAGLILGRFQPLHLEHLEYAQAARERCDFLWVGLTNFMPSSLESEGDTEHRLRRTSNLLKYSERYTLIAESFKVAGFKVDEFGIVPCPIESPQCLVDIVPQETKCFVTINEEWGRAKVEALRGAGYEVEVLWEREKGMSGTAIRKAICQGDEGWRSLVPEPVAQRLLEWGFCERVREAQE